MGKTEQMIFSTFRHYRSWAGIKEQAIEHTMYNQNQCSIAVPLKMQGIAENLSIAQGECINTSNTDYIISHKIQQNKVNTFL